MSAFAWFGSGQTERCLPEATAAEGAGQSGSLVSIAGSETNEITMEGLYHEHYRALVRHARRWVGPHDAEDIVQDAFRYCWERINGEGIPRDILKRLHRRTMHGCFDLRRKLTRCEPRDPAAFEALPHAPALDALRNRELLDRWNEEVADPESRRLIRFLLSGMAHAQIAEVEKVPVGTVKWRIHALRRKLRIRKNNSNLSAS